MIYIFSIAFLSLRHRCLSYKTSLAGGSKVMHTLQAMHTLAISETQGYWRKFFVTCVHKIYSFLFLGTLSHISMCVFIISAINNNNYYSPKWSWLVVVIYRILSPSSCISGTACLIIREILCLLRQQSTIIEWGIVWFEDEPKGSG